LEAAGIEFPFPQRDMHVYYHDDDNGEENGKNKDIP
jgi:small-conductance mechanosensitive channel